ncbi:alpha/beta fold hydrolase [Massilia sp. PWRC2]|uniref:alpha/beta fold hydrolase n=1 Tax=Massilia sp. PWRC2 TaxID=2804626 RepID=UPI003CEA678C
MTTRRTVLATALSLAIVSLFAGRAISAFAAEATPATRISVTVEGSGSDVVLIAGLNSSPRVWRELIAATPGHRYHLVQVSGFAGAAAGANVEGPVAAPVAEDIARYIETTITGKKLPKPALIGHSMGGTIGLMVASRHPQLVERLMVVDMVPFLGALFGPPGTTAASITPTADGILAAMRAAEPEARRTRAIGTINSMINNVPMRAGAIDDSLTSTADVSARAYHELVVTDLRPELAAITAPLTVLYIAPKGLMDGPQADAAYKGAYAGAKTLRLKRIDDSAHFIMWDQPAQFQAEVKQFLK